MNAGDLGDTELVDLLGGDIHRRIAVQQVVVILAALRMFPYAVIIIGDGFLFLKQRDQTAIDRRDNIVERSSGCFEQAVGLLLAEFQRRDLATEITHQRAVFTAVIERSTRDDVARGGHHRLIGPARGIDPHFGRAAGVRDLLVHVGAHIAQAADIGLGIFQGINTVIIDQEGRTVHVRAGARCECVAVIPPLTARLCAGGIVLGETPGNLGGAVQRVKVEIVQHVLVLFAALFVLAQCFLR